jgi:hypothetical protein
MQRILDLDLDFFLDEVAYDRRRGQGRLDGAAHRPWPIDDVVAFLKKRCRLSRKLPGFAVEYHDELFARWRDAIAAGRLDSRFHVTHVDAHADLGVTGNSVELLRYLMGDLLFRPVEDRCFPAEGNGGVTDASWLAFAIACRWVSDLVYVMWENDPDWDYDLHPYLMEDFALKASAIQLKAVAPDEYDKVVLGYGWGERRNPTVTNLEPPVPFRRIPWRDFHADAPFDVICLACSPDYTPPEANEIFDEIRKRFIDETSF